MVPVTSHAVRLTPAIAPQRPAVAGSTASKSFSRSVRLSPRMPNRYGRETQRSEL